jgi:type IX secretion system PorP/SprF family membrane protein
MPSKIVYHLFFILLLPIMSYGQQIEQYTMWNQNHYLINPAAAGYQEYFEAAIGFRRQWAGIKEAPRSFYATAHTVVNRPKTYQLSALRISSTHQSDFYQKGKNKKNYTKHAVGGKLSSNEFGAFGKSEVIMTYSLHLPVRNDISLALGVSAGLNSFSFDESKASVLREGDPVYNAYIAGENSNKLNVNTGAYIYSDKFYGGYAAHQILQNDLELADISTHSAEASMILHHFAMAGYNFDLDNNWRLTPNILAKLAGTNPLSIEAGANLSYQESIYIGANYRTDDAISLLLGMQFNHLLRAGYAFDYTFSELNERAYGSHELFIGLTLF